MATISLSRALADCLEALQKENESLEACLERYPQYREELRSLLEVAQALRAARAEKQPSPMFVIGLKNKLTKKRARSLKGGASL